MNHQLCVLLYSKYSQTCKNLVTSIPKFVKDKIGLQLVCVDNEDIRKRITKSSSVKINSVPTILLLYSNGGVEKYEGNTSFLWLNQIINQLPLNFMITIKVAFSDK
jgi:thioredoxin-like negative regulator of GroEL